MQDSITVIIPTLTNTKGIISELKALGKYPVIVIDNAPSPEKKLACFRHGDCIYLPQAKNLGFARAINLGFLHVQTDWICILNDDIEFTGVPPFAKLIQLAESHGWDAVSPLLTKKTGEIENLGYRVLPIGRTELIFDHTTHMDGITAACLMMETDVFKKLDGFDERFISYLEDVDIFLRLKKAGYLFGIDFKTSVIHNHMTTSRKMGNFKAKMDLRNWCLLIAKHWSLSLLIRHAPGIIVERLRNISGYLKATWNAENKKKT